MSRLSCLYLGLSLALSGTAVAAELDYSKMQQLGPVTATSAMPLSASPKADALRNNIARHLNDSALDSKVAMFGQDYRWQKVSKNNPDGAWLALQTQVTTQRFTQGKLTIAGLENPQLYIAGERVGSGDEIAITLRNGDYNLLILADGQSKDEALSIDWQGDADVDTLTLSKPANKRVSAELLFDSEVVNQLSLSPDGDYMLQTKTHYDASKGDSAIRVTELVKRDNQQLLYRWSDKRPSSVTWSANSKQLAFVYDGKIQTLTLADLSLTTLADDMKNVSGLTWVNDSLIFSWEKPFKADEKATNKRFQALQDRWSYWRNNAQIYQIDSNSGFIRQLTENAISSNLIDVSENGETLLLSRHPVDYKEPAHGISHLIELNLADLKETEIGSYRTFASALYAEGGMYMLAGPNFMNGLGKQKSDLIVNDYDTQLYWRDANGKVTALSKDFDPSIGNAKKLPNGDLILQVGEQDRTNLYWYDKSKAKFNRLNTGLDVTNVFSVASGKSNTTLVYAGTSATEPQQAYSMNLKSQKKSLFDSRNRSYSDRKLGKIEDFDFTNKHGHNIDGRVYLPTDFDSNKKYPALVYYYGGTSPVGRNFTGRWPFNLWAAQGYVVYVLQPNGATGYGQEFSGRHVNAWGEFSADDIIEGTQKFLQAHDYVDPERVGNMGASYGGFMTMYLSTKTDIFAASMSHAGISNLSAYWGHGWWGYGYSGVASRGSFPWNNKQLYVEHSPMYHADKVTKPLLLLHGNADTNVPVGESHYMYTALKLLGKPVELIEFNGQDHHINGRQARFDWWDATLAWFDMHLKDEPQWWNYLYPETKAEQAKDQ
ncbi:alpha/beta hydrolase family protein [Paraferrimonas haliotis]|uniref:alpha/beta hydrolase family protein n=1 Tax=Paraferrimonas haliotis TaxID=2013866 RepID=UPI000BA936E1|nr:prolyl oligopeptidase family serine peptidase [Paraferrimonas haliotis]